ncbi:MAG: hypothetical protein GC137_06760 [Alphaproteobacteria bacterium]|nr:hypothetical protein [Alphaproteobacteria bacterium]
MFVQLTDSVGNNLRNEESDVLQFKSALNRLGFLDFSDEIEPHGIITNETRKAITDFQKQQKLYVDGRLFPEGETEGRINTVLKSSDSGEDDSGSQDDDSVTPSAPPAPVESEPLPPPTKNILGTNIPDKGVPEQGFPGSSKFDPHAPKFPINPDPGLEIIPPNTGSNTPIYGGPRGIPLELPSIRSRRP